MNKLLPTILLTIILLLNINEAVKQVDIPELNQKTFDKLTSSNKAFIMFKTNWCGHCQTEKPKLFNVANKLAKSHPDIKIALVDCTDQKELCKKQKITAYPILRLYKDNRNWYEFDSEISESGLTNFFNSPNEYGHARSLDDPDFVETKHVQVLSKSHFEDVLKNYRIAIVYFTTDWCLHCTKDLLVVDKVAFKMNDVKDKRIFLVHCNKDESKELCEEKRIFSFPTINYYSNGTYISAYNDEVSNEGFENFFKSPSSVSDIEQEKLKSDSKSEPKSEHEEEKNILDKFQYVKVLSKNDYTQLIEKATNPKEDIMIMFMAPWCGACQAASPDYDQVAQTIKTMKHELGRSIIISAVNCDDTVMDEICNKNGIEGYPTFLHFKNGKKIKEFNYETDLKGDMLKYILKSSSTTTKTTTTTSTTSRKSKDEL